MQPGSKEAIFRARVLEILGALALQWPSLSVTVDLWRPMVISHTADEYSDATVERWIRLGESVPAFFVESQERWFEKDVGIIRENQNWVIIPGGYELEPDDHIILKGRPWMVIKAAEQAGISKIQVDLQKSRFVAPARTEAVNRLLGIKVLIA
jgi:hypothetical protein